MTMIAAAAWAADHQASPLPTSWRIAPHTFFIGSRALEASGPCDACRKSKSRALIQQPARDRALPVDFPPPKKKDFDLEISVSALSKGRLDSQGGI